MAEAREGVAAIPREQTCGHHWMAEGFVVRCGGCETTLAVGVTDMTVLTLPPSEETNLGNRARALAAMLAAALNENERLRGLLGRDDG